MKNEKEVVAFLRKHWIGDYHRIENAIASGMPDINSCYKGRECWCEIKYDTLDIRKYQKVWAHCRSKVGGRVWTISYNPAVSTFYFYLHPVAMVELTIVGYPTMKIHKSDFGNDREHIFSVLHGLPIV